MPEDIQRRGRKNDRIHKNRRGTVCFPRRIFMFHILILYCAVYRSPSGTAPVFKMLCIKPAHPE